MAIQTLDAAKAFLFANDFHMYRYEVVAAALLALKYYDAANRLTSMH